MTKTLLFPPHVVDQYHEKVTRSMAFLDDYLGGPEWVNMIDLEALDLEDATQCVCGQLFNEATGLRTVEDMEMTDGYVYALKHVVEHGVPEHMVGEEANKHDLRSRAANYLGFNLDHDRVDDAIAIYNGYRNDTDMWSRISDDDIDFLSCKSPWRMFTEVWRERIEKRRADLGTMA